MDKICFSFFVCVVLFGSEVGTVTSVPFPQVYVQVMRLRDTLGGSLIKLHADKCKSSNTRTWCTASANASYPNDPLAILTMRHHHGDNVCFEIKHNESQYSLKVLNHSEIVFEKLSSRSNCRNDSANLFHMSDFVGDEDFVRLRSQRPGLIPPAQAYLSASENYSAHSTRGKLFLTKKKGFLDQLYISRPPN
ncbi:uncharacterized protein [Montipora capricornis]|uniref:uncharacterized protein isoform X1 n=1 Tax=Montipora capricornis TaxID=246305 RepID=UPI0035F1C9C9